MGVAPAWCFTAFSPLHAECQIGNVRTAVLRVPQSVFTFEDLSFGALNDEVKKRLFHIGGVYCCASSSVVLDLNGISEDVAGRRG